MNDMYAKDISKKIRSVLKEKQKQGEYMCSIPAYGYKRHPTIKNKLIVDTDTHAPGDLITFDKSYQIALGAGLTHQEAIKAIVDNPRELLKNKGIL